jgi:hypothetical protein
MTAAECHQKIQLASDAHELGLLGGPKGMLHGQPVLRRVASEIGKSKFSNQVAQSIGDIDVERLTSTNLERLRLQFCYFGPGLSRRSSRRCNHLHAGRHVVLDMSKILRFEQEGCEPS